MGKNKGAPVPDFFAALEPISAIGWGPGIEVRVNVELEEATLSLMEELWGH